MTREPSLPVFGSGAVMPKTASRNCAAQPGNGLMSVIYVECSPCF
jgi:hypothetical protein